MRKTSTKKKFILNKLVAYEQNEQLNEKYQF